MRERQVILISDLSTIAHSRVWLTQSVRAGDINPARAVDIVGSDGNATFIDIRTSREKEAVGVPDVPSSAKGRFVELEMASVDRRLRGQLRNVDAVEAQVLLCLCHCAVSAALLAVALWASLLTAVQSCMRISAQAFQASAYPAA